MKKMTAMFLALSLMSALALADEGKKKHYEPSAEDRKKMAEMHTKMAECLKSDKSVHDCHEEMMKSCKDMGESCPLNHHRMRGHHHDEGKAQE